MSFDPNEKGKIIKESSLRWFPINTYQRQEISNKLKIHNYSFQSSLIANFEGLTREETEGFQIE